jgi:hypothetical protein
MQVMWTVILSLGLALAGVLGLALAMRIGEWTRRQ